MPCQPRSRAIEGIRQSRWILLEVWHVSLCTLKVCWKTSMNIIYWLLQLDVLLTKSYWTNSETEQHEHNNLQCRPTFRSWCFFLCDFALYIGHSSFYMPSLGTRALWTGALPWLDAWSIPDSSRRKLHIFPNILAWFQCTYLRPRTQQWHMRKWGSPSMFAVHDLEKVEASPSNKTGSACWEDSQKWLYPWYLKQIGWWKGRVLLQVWQRKREEERNGVKTVSEKFICDFQHWSTCPVSKQICWN